MKTFGAIFDFDGVIVDSSRQHETSWERLAVEINASLPEDHFERSFGMKNEVIIPHILEWSMDDEEIHALSMRKEELYREIVAETGLEPLPGIAEWLERLHEAGIPCVIGSSSHRANIDLVLHSIGFMKQFNGAICGEDVQHGKPDPEVFVKGAALLGFEPEACVVFEDAPAGVEAGLRGNMRVVAVTSTRDAEALSDAHLVVENLGDLQIEQVAGLFRENQPVNPPS